MFLNPFRPFFSFLDPNVSFSRSIGIGAQLHGSVAGLQHVAGPLEPTQGSL